MVGRIVHEVPTFDYIPWTDLVYISNSELIQTSEPVRKKNTNPKHNLAMPPKTKERDEATAKAEALEKRIKELEAEAKVIHLLFSNWFCELIVVL